MSSFPIRFESNLVTESPLQKFLKKFHRPNIFRLTQPEHRFLADLGIPIIASDLDEHGYSFLLRKLAEGEYGLVLHLELRVVIDCMPDGGHRLPSRLLCEPEERLPAHARTLI